MTLYIDGKFETGADSQRQPVVNPATGEVIAQAARATAEETRRAVAAARAAFDRGPWGQATPMARGRVLLEVARRLRERAAELAQLETENVGKPLVESEFDVADAATCFEYYGGMATKIYGDVNPVPDEALSLTLREPVGVCGQIIPWNYPLMMAAWKIAPGARRRLHRGAQARRGRPPSPCSSSAAILDAIDGLPKGVVNVVTGDGPVAGARWPPPRRRQGRLHRQPATGGSDHAAPRRTRT